MQLFRKRGLLPTSHKSEAPESEAPQPAETYRDTPLPYPERAFEQIERLTKRYLTVETSLVDNLAKCNQQQQSPLYSLLPKEIRDMIFALATTQCENPQEPYEETDWWYRPGYQARHRSRTNLLLTCRRVWLETSALPLKDAVHPYWYNNERRPPHAGSMEDWSFTLLNLQNVHTVHLFMQMCEAEGLPRNVFNLENKMHGMQPRILKFTIRHSDWWYWERDNPMSLKEKWVQCILNNPWISSIEKFELELETIERNTKQLQPIVDGLLKLKGPVRSMRNENSNGQIKTQLQVRDAPSAWHWTGPSQLGGMTHRIYRDMDKLNYHVVVLTWLPVRIPVAEGDEGCGDNTLENGPPMTDWTPFGTVPRLMAPYRRPFGSIRHMPRRWKSFVSLPQFVAVQSQSFRQAAAVQDGWADRFERWNGDMLTKELEEKWRAENSLLKLVD